MSLLQQTDPKNRYFINEALTDPSALRTIRSPLANLLASLNSLITTCPPTLPWAGRSHGGSYCGLFAGPTSIAFLFLWLSKTHPDLRIYHQSPGQYCGAYLDLGQDQYEPEATQKSGCSLHHEYMCYNAVKACYTNDMSYVRKFVDNLGNPTMRAASDEVIYGKAGLLGLMRTMKDWLPESSEMLNPAIDLIIEDCLAHDPWTFGSSQKRYLGAAHGDISIISNIAMANPAYAPAVQRRLEHVLTLQQGDGNWPTREDGGAALVQWCHGAAGMVWCLVPLRQHFPALRARIDEAVGRARGAVWERGLLTKESCLCHGIMGNALALEGAQRGHFLFYTTPEMVEEGRADGSVEASSDADGVWWGEASRAWGWMMADYDRRGGGDSLVDIGYPGVTNP